MGDRIESTTTELAVMPRYLVGLFVVCAAVASGLVDDATEHRELTQSLGPVELSEAETMVQTGAGELQKAKAHVGLRKGKKKAAPGKVTKADFPKNNVCYLYGNDVNKPGGNPCPSLQAVASGGKPATQSNQCATLPSYAQYKVQGKKYKLAGKKLCCPPSWKLGSTGSACKGSKDAWKTLSSGSGSSSSAPSSSGSSSAPSSGSASGKRKGKRNAPPGSGSSRAP